MKLTPGVAVPLFAAGLVAGGPLAPRQLTSYVAAAATQRAGAYVSVVDDGDAAEGPVPDAIINEEDYFIKARAVQTSTVKAAAAAPRQTVAYVFVGDNAGAGAGAEADDGFAPAPTSIINDEDNFIKARAVYTTTANGAAAAPRRNDAYVSAQAKANAVQASAIDAENEIMARAAYSTVSAAAAAAAPIHSAPNAANEIMARAVYSTVSAAAAAAAPIPSAPNAANEINARNVHSALRDGVAAAAAAPAPSVPTAVPEHAEHVRPRSVDDNNGDFRIDRHSCTKSQRREISKALGNCAYVSQFAAWFTGQKGMGDELIAGSFGASDIPTRKLLLNDFLTMQEYCRERDAELWILRGRDVEENRRTVSCLTEAECEVVGDELPFVVRQSESGDVGICPGSFGRREGACGRLGLANVFLQRAAEIVSATYKNKVGSVSRPWNAEAFMTVATGFNLSCIAYLPATQTARLRE